MQKNLGFFMTKESILLGIISLDRHSDPVAHTFKEICNNKAWGNICGIVDPMILEHFLFQLVRENKIKKIGMDDNYQKCLFIRINLESLKATNTNRVKEFTNKLNDAVKNTAKSTLNFKKKSKS